MKRKIPETLVSKAREFLTEDGIEFFRECQREYGTVSPIIAYHSDVSGRVFPHVVHFREGMRVRNFMRKQPECAEWGPHDFDDSWRELVEKTIL